MTNEGGSDDVLQNQLYSSVWGAYATAAYNRSTGTPPIAVAGVMNAADGTVHCYSNYNFAPDLLAGDLASRTIAAALQLYRMPATVAV